MYRVHLNHAVSINTQSQEKGNTLSGMVDSVFFLLITFNGEEVVEKLGDGFKANPLVQETSIWSWIKSS